MINANAARKIVDDLYSEEIKDVENAIKEEARKGFTYCYVSTLSDYVHSLLVKQGYKVEWLDQYYKISW